jgi:hypothetical protein
MTEYFLFLDESQPAGSLSYFCFAGYVASKKEYESSIIPKVNKLKNDFFGKTDIVLHEASIRDFEGIFADLKNDLKKREAFWKGIHDIFDACAITVIGTCVSTAIPQHLYKSINVNSYYHISLQIILENYVHFLEKHDARGHVIVESNTSNEKLRHLYHTIVSHGTLFFGKNAFQKRLIDINFYSKEDNNAGLQLADFIPNPVNRNFSGAKQKSYSLMKIIEAKLYDGGIPATDRFGMKIVE